MSHIRDIRQAIDARLDQWTAAALAMEAKFDESKEEAVKEIEVQKQRVRESLDRLHTRIDEAKVLAEDKKRELNSKFEYLQVQLALGKAEARDAFESRRREIERAISRLEDVVEDAVRAAGETAGTTIDSASKEFAEAAIKLDAELDAVGRRFDAEKAKRHAELEEKSKKIVETFESFKEGFDETTKIAGEKAGKFGKEFFSGMSHIKDAFKGLFS
jgi:hypothetical protein